MDRSLTERRAHNRFGHHAVSQLRALLRPGRLVWLVNLSVGGALIEARRPLRPGARVYLHLSTDRRAAGRVAHVLRCSVASLAGDEGVRYRGAVKFDDEWMSVWEELTLSGYRVPVRKEGETRCIGQDLPIRD